MREMKKVMGIAGLALTIVLVLSCPNPAGGGSNDGSNGGNGINGTYVSMDAGYSYELSIVAQESRAASAKNGDKYTLNVFDGNTKIASRSGTVKTEGDTITPYP